MTDIENPNPVESVNRVLFENFGNIDPVKWAEQHKFRSISPVDIQNLLKQPAEVEWPDASTFFQDAVQTFRDHMMLADIQRDKLARRDAIRLEMLDQNESS